MFLSNALKIDKKILCCQYSTADMRQATRDNAEPPCKHPTTKIQLKNSGIDYHRRGGTSRLNTSIRLLARKPGPFLRYRRRRVAGTRRRWRRRWRRRRNGDKSWWIGSAGLIRGLADTGIHIACPTGTYLLASLYTLYRWNVLRTGVPFELSSMLTPVRMNKVFSVTLFMPRVEVPL